MYINLAVFPFYCFFGQEYFLNPSNLYMLSNSTDPPLNFGLSLCCHGDEVWLGHWHWDHWTALLLSGSVCCILAVFGQLKTTYVIVLAPLEEVYEVNAGRLHVLQSLVGVHLFHGESTQQSRQQQILQVRSRDFLQRLITAAGKREGHFK